MQFNRITAVGALKTHEINLYVFDYRVSTAALSYTRYNLYTKR